MRNKIMFGIINAEVIIVCVLITAALIQDWDRLSSVFVAGCIVLIVSLVAVVTAAWMVKIWE